MTTSDEYRIVLFIPLLRLFSVVRRTRAIVFGVLFSLHSVLPILLLLVMVEYCFAAVGVWLFGGKLSEVPESSYVMDGMVVLVV